MAYTYIVSEPCHLCEVRHEISVPYSEEEFQLRMRNWIQGDLIQVALPDLTPEQRELLLTGNCNDAWNELFGEDEEDKGKSAEFDEEGLPF